MTGSKDAHPIARMREGMPARPENLRSVLVYGSASTDIDPRFIALGHEMGRRIAQAGCNLVYGGGSLGMMGASADGALAVGGKVTGIIPQFMKDAEAMHKGVTDLKVVDDMHTRKRMMFDAADAMIALPGGYGTVEELFEVMTWKQVGRHNKPIVIVNLLDYWQPMIDFIDHMDRHKFLHHRSDTFAVAETPVDVMELLGLG